MHDSDVSASYSAHSIDCALENQVLGGAISRRRFLALAGVTAAAVGTAGLHSVQGGIVYAYANDAEGGDQVSFVVDVLSRKSVGFLVNDVTKGTTLVEESGEIAQAQVLSGAKVVLHSLYNNKTVEGISNAEGKVVFDDITALAKLDADTVPISYHFWGSIEVTLDGYRTFKTGRVFIQGAHFFVAATQPTTPTASYLRCCTYEGYDIQYFPCTMPSTKQIADKHTVRCEVVAPSSKAVEVELYNDGWWSGIKASANVSDGIANIDIPYNYSSDSKLVDEKTSLTIWLDGKKAYKVSTKLMFKEAPVEKPTDGKAKVTPGENNASSATTPDDESVVGGHLVITLPEKIPIVGGATFDPGVGSLPVAFRFDPWGLSFIGINVTFPYEEFNGEYQEGSWKRQNLETMKQRREYMEKGFIGAINRYDQCKRHQKDKNTFFGKSPRFSSFSTGLSFQLLATGGYDWKADDGHWEIGPQLTVGFFFAYEVSQQFMLGPVPVFVGFGFNFDIALVLRYLARINGLDFTSMTWSSKNNEPFTFKIDLGIGVTAGVGIKGFLSVSVTGRAGVDVAITAHDHKDLPQPHCVTTLNAGVVIVGQFLFFTVTSTPYNKVWDNPPYEDNWVKKLGPEEVPEANNASPLYPEMLGGGGPEAGDWTIVTERTLGETAEFAGTEPGEALDGLSAFVFDDEDAWTGASVSDFGIAGATELGVDPAVDALIFKDVLSDPRTKVVSFIDRTFLFRLASVKIASGNGSVVRTRVCVSQLVNGVWDKPSVLDMGHKTTQTGGGIEFVQDDSLAPEGTFMLADSVSFDAPSEEEMPNGINEKTKRIDLFDVDFDVQQMPAGFALIVTSSARPSGDETTIGAAGDATCATIALFGVSDIPGHVEYDYKSSVTIYGKKIAGKQPFIFKPALATILGRNEGLAMLQLSVSDGTLPGALASVRYFLNISFSVNEAKAFSKVSHALVSRGNNGEHWTDLMLPRSKATEFILPIAGRYQAADGKNHLAFYFGGTVKDVEVANPAVEVCWLGYEAALFVDDKQLKLVNSAGVRTVSIDGFNHDSFRASDDGKHLFWMQTEEGRGRPQTDKDGNVIPDSAPKVEVFQIMAAKRYGSGSEIAFTSPFALARVGKRVDYLASTTSSRSSLDFCYMHFTNPSRSAADLYFTSIPWVQSVLLKGCSCDDPFVGAGEQAPLSLRVVNTGSVCVDGMRVSIYDNAQKQGNPIDTFDVSFTKDTLQNSINMFNPDSPNADEDGFVFEALGDAGEDPGITALAEGFNINGVLLPGQDRVYTGTMKVPADWKTGKRELHAFIDSTKATLTGDFAETLPDNPEDLLTWQSDAPASFVFDTMPSAQRAALSEYEYFEAPPADDPKTLVKTGDGLDLPLGLGTLAAAGGAVAIGLAAYNKRRAENEDS